MASNTTIEQKVIVHMDLVTFKGTWDTNASEMISPTYQEIVFENSKATSFSFNVLLNQGKEKYQHSNEPWSRQINSSLYMERKRYKVFVKFHYQGKTSIIIETCTGVTMTSNYSTLDTSKWRCLESSKANPEVIDIELVCDGFWDCENGSDETSGLCRPEFTYFEIIVYSLGAVYLLSGATVFIGIHAVHPPSVSTIIRLPKLVLNYSKRKGVKKIHKNTCALLNICKVNNTENAGKDVLLKDQHLQTIRRIFKPCQNESSKRVLFKFLCMLSLDHAFEKSVHQIIDEIVRIEVKVRDHKGED